MTMDILDLTTEPIINALLLLLGRFVAPNKHIYKLRGSICQPALGEKKGPSAEAPGPVSTASAIR